MIYVDMMMNLYRSSSKITRTPSVPALAIIVIVTLLLQSNASAFVTTKSYRRHVVRTIQNNYVGGGVVRRDTATELQVAPQQLGSFEKLTDGGDEMMIAPFREKRRVWLYDFVSTPKSTLSDEQTIQSSTVPYHDAWELQKQLVDYQLARIGKRPSDLPIYSQFIPMHFDFDDDDNRMYARCNRGSVAPPSNLMGCDSIIMLQHDPVYTLGTASDPSFIRNDNENSNAATTEIPVVRIERGGEVTYHGPGQLTVYPILDLRGYKQDVHWYMRALEEVILLALEKAGVKGAVREDNLTGVWVSNKKIAALGIKARRWVTMHGLAINVDMRSLQNFEGIVPCGLEGRKVTCINEENGNTVTTVEQFSYHVKEALEEIFCVALIPVTQTKRDGVNGIN